MRAPLGPAKEAVVVRVGKGRADWALTWTLDEELRTGRRRTEAPLLVAAGTRAVGRGAHADVLSTPLLSPLCAWRCCSRARLLIALLPSALVLAASSEPAAMALAEKPKGSRRAGEAFGAGAVSGVLTR